MNCPICNTDIPEGLLYCPKCGEEIRIVPDFEPEIDESLNATISDVASIVEDTINPQDNSDDGINGDTKEIVKENIDKTDIDITNKSKPAKKANNKSKSKNKSVNKDIRLKKMLKVGIFAGAGLVFAIICGVIIFYASRYYSFDYQYNNALKEYEIGNYEDSIRYAKRAVSIDHNNKASKLLLSDSYYNIGKYDESIAVLEEMKDSYVDQMFLEKLISDYEALGDYASISELLITNDNADLNAKYSNYLVSDPTFSVEPGTYEDSVTVEILNEGSGSIYYTTDGTTPGKGSFIYSGPITLGEGITILSAMVINDNGISSEVISGSYDVTATVVNSVRLITTSGKYTIPKLIKVEALSGGKIYYTCDGTDPTNESAEYTQPIFMPLGVSKYKFIVYDNDKCSDIVVADYNLNIEGLLDKLSAETAVQLRLMALGDIESVTNHYISKNGYGFGANSFYIVNEYKSDAKTPTGRQFAVDARTGSIFTFTYNETEMDYTLVPM